MLRSALKCCKMMIGVNFIIAVVDLVSSENCVSPFMPLDTERCVNPEAF